MRSPTLHRRRGRGGKAHRARFFGRRQQQHDVGSIRQGRFLARGDGDQRDRKAARIAHQIGHLDGFA